MKWLMSGMEERRSEPDAQGSFSLRAKELQFFRKEIFTKAH